MVVEENQKEILISWKEISAYLGCETRTCQRWEKESGLPVHRFIDSSRSRVFAYKQELNHWLKRRPYTDQKNPKKLLYFLIPMAALLIVCFMFLSPLSSPEPHDFRINGSDLVVLNEKQKEIWQYHTETMRLKDEEFYRKRFQVRRDSDNSSEVFHPLIVMRDIDNDRQKEVLFAQRSIVPNRMKCILSCLNNKGKILWVFEAGREMIFGKKQYSSRYEIGGFMVVDLEMDNSPEIIVVSRNLYMFPTQLAVLDSKGHLLREYWHSGRILDFTFYDLDHDEEKEIILSGCNNEYDKGFLAVLEPDFKSGGSPQTGYYKSPNLKQNVEKYYILIPNTIVDKNEYKRGNVIKIHISDERIIYAETKSGLCFEFGFNFELKEIRFADRYEDMYNKAYREGIAKEKFSVKTMDELKTNLMTQVLYYTDEYWSQAPLLARNQVPD